MSAPAFSELQKVIEKHWGFRELRPLQARAMQAVIDRRDSLVVMPTGGGKSLCYHAPAVHQGGTTVVVSPLISLMKDQVDSLRACGVSAAQIDSTLPAGARRILAQQLRRGEIRLLFVSPERLVMPEFVAFIKEIGVHTFAIDEAHCISHWGHNFRPEYRQLSNLRQLFPEASIHGYTATATEQVRTDICKQLSLRKPEVLVGDFDRPNLNYRVLPRHDLYKQIDEVLARHRNEAGIIYCIRRKDVDEVSEMLKVSGYDVLPYHAGLEGQYRSFVQDAFASEKCNLIVATVAFGMGIDRSNLRFILHTGMPKSVEHYQQEIGRAGRDGLEAECVLLYSVQDYRTWEYILEKSFEDPNVDATQFEVAMQHLRDMTNYCREAVCRHRALVTYFGQTYKKPNCQACDLCLGDTEELADAQVVAQKILSCVARVKESYGVGHVVSVLRGENTDKIRRFGHDQLSTYGLLREIAKPALRHLVHQLISQEVLVQNNVTLSNGKTVPIVGLNEASWQVMRGQRKVRLHKLVQKGQDEVLESEAEKTSWEGVDRDLFEVLREVRREIAQARNVAAFIILSDRSLRDLARFRPSTLERMSYLHGIGQTKLSEFGDRLLAEIKAYCRANKVSMDIPFPKSLRAPSTKTTTPSKQIAFQLFRKGISIEEVADKTGRAEKTVIGYLSDYIIAEKPRSITAWVSDATYKQIAEATQEVGAERLKPIFVKLEEKVSYEEIRLVVAHLNAGNNTDEKTDDVF